MPPPPITIQEVLQRWRDRICFADEVRLKDGRHATVVRGGPVMPITLEVIIGLPHQRAKEKEIVNRNDLFPAWWPPSQWPPPCPSTYTHTTLGKLSCEKDEAHLHRSGDVEHQRGVTKWMSV